MSTVIILTPVIIASWPAITAAVAGAAAAMGLAVKNTAQQEDKVRDKENVQSREVEVELEESQISTANLATDQEIVVTKGNVVLRVRRDERGRCTVCAKGLGKTDAQLKQIAEEFSQRMVQCFTYNRVMSELKSKGFQVVNEEVGQNQEVRIHVRRWEN
jgi:ABC-type transporter MlaC component